MADAQITLAYSRGTGIVAVTNGEQYKSAERVLRAAGFRRGTEDPVYRLPTADEATARAVVTGMVRRAEEHGVSVTTSSRRFIGDAAGDIVLLLPGQWQYRVEVYSHPVWQGDLVPYLWDSGELAQAVRTDRAIPYAATLKNPGSGTSLLLVERPGHRLGYLVGAFAPEFLGEGVGDPHAPRSVVLPPLPGRAAQAIAHRYLPAYDRAVHERRTARVAEALDLIRSRLGGHPDLRVDAGRGAANLRGSAVSGAAEGRFLDSAWREFLTVLDHAPALLERCRPAASAWPQDAPALLRLAATLKDAAGVRADLNSGGPISRAEHHARVRPVIETWLTHGERFLRQARACAPQPRSRVVVPASLRPLPPGMRPHTR
ncbi:hypothetical protein [Streptomyces murinus]|uniref:hypothetical protein n=1 Tax=Streptomyces murinus TaxID=33900 RepID=UPI003F44AD36